LSYRFDRIEKKRRLQAAGWKKVVDLTQKAKGNGIPVLSFDDDTEQKVNLVQQLGATGSGFPITMEAVLAAKNKRMSISMAHNMGRDCSSSGHPTAAETILANACDGLISDYYPECMIQWTTEWVVFIAPQISSRTRCMDSGKI
jgi:alpha-D-ribose 1-methylphosphonate 5-triphosphate diphosphatase